ncbi:hypothetical protein AA23498_1177 [Acetobacter nitrogenifigens DSM 23921 = NBRC 105050]|nr:hypothetical protein AA23498_1177 [Acetobacter nitrogenifigens DSM 23921 = NBRC 105050]
MRLKELIQIHFNIVEWPTIFRVWIAEAFRQRIEILHLSDHSLHASSKIVIVTISERRALPK